MSTDISDVDMQELAFREFEPWERGREAPMTPAALMDAASGPFWGVFFAYEIMFKSKAELVELAGDGCDLPDEFTEAFKMVSDAGKWLHMIANVADSAAQRMISAACANALRPDARP